ncbi:MAG: hypothetical protein JSV56_01155 [Methanomassiliicoccales archaeon]|nr:MAG: hypothetical protein JSV56_01155 [Methanomassiliicoccales archaeon]
MNKSSSGITKQSGGPRRIRTKIIDDVFTDEVDMVKPRFEVDYQAYLDRLWKANPEIYNCLKQSSGLEEARDKLYTYLEQAERKIFKIDNDLHILEKATVRECIRVFKSIIGPVNEYRTKSSALECLWRLARGELTDAKTEVSAGFLIEFINLFRGVDGRSNIYFESKEARKGIPDFLRLKGRKACRARTEILDDIGVRIQKYLKKYPSGLDPDVVNWRKENRTRIIHYLGAKESDWDDYVWHLKHVIREEKPLLKLI